MLRIHIPLFKKGFRVNAIIHQRLAVRKQRLMERLDKFNFPDDVEQLMLRSANIRNRFQIDILVSPGRLNRVVDVAVQSLRREVRADGRSVGVGGELRGES